jgi:molybdopterin-binding protein
MRSSKLATMGIFALLIAAGCTGPGKATKAAAPASAPAVSANILKGKVVETMDGGGYTYIQLDNDGKKTWAAVPAMTVKVGDEVQLLGGAEMNNFPSKALDRTFDKIIFSGGVYEPTAAAATAKTEKLVMAEKTIMAGKVAETMNAGTYTYLRIEKDGKNSWAAVPAVKVAVGDEVELKPGTEMGQFSSPSLNRTFENIYFSSGLAKGGAEPVAAAPAAAPAAAAGEEKAPAQALPAGHPKLDAAAPAAAAPAAPAPAAITGKVTETMDSGGYSYICVEKDGKKTWAAIPATKVSVGQQVSVAPGITMPNFTSKSLNRTFDKIIFSSGLAE